MSRLSFPYKATYAGVCGECGGDYPKGAMIIWANGQVNHVDCVEEDDGMTGLDETKYTGSTQRGPIKLLRPKCPKCNLELPKSMVCGYC